MGTGKGRGKGGRLLRQQPARGSPCMEHPHMTCLPKG